MEIQVEAGGEVRLLRVKRGENLMEALLRHGVTLPHPCRGKGKCGKCRVGISDWDGEGGADITQKKESVRLACMTEIKGPVSVQVGSKGSFNKRIASEKDKQAMKAAASPSSDKQAMKAAASPSPDKKGMKADAFPLHAKKSKTKAPSPPFHRTCAHIPEAGSSGASTWARLVGGFSGKDRKALEWGMETALPYIEDVLPLAGGTVTLTRTGKRFFALETGDATRNRLGVAIIVSDGRLSAALVMLEDGRILETLSMDMARGSGGKALTTAMNSLVETLCANCGKTAAEISDAVVAGDSAVLYALTKLIMKKADLAAWAGDQALPVIMSRQRVRADKLGLGLGRHAGVWLPPAVSAAHGPDWVLSRLASANKDVLPGSAGGEKDALGSRALKGAISCLLDGRARKEAMRLAAGRSGDGKQ